MKRFTIVNNGYNVDEVNRFIDVVIKRLEKEYNVITLENGIEYTEIDRINFNNNCYVVLSNLDDPSDFCIRRLVNDNNQE